MSSASFSIGGLIEKNKKKTTTVRMVEGVQFPVISPESVAETLNLLDEAKQLGDKNLPASDQSTRFGTAEMKIDTEIQRVVTGYHDRAIHRVETLDENINSELRNTSEEVRKFYALPNQFEQDVADALSDSSEEFNILKQRASQAREEYEAFRKENNLQRSAEIKSRPWQFFKFFFVVLIVVFEGLVNAALFATNMEGGLLQGFLIAMASSAVNVVLAAFIGYFGVRFINHARRFWLGWLSLLLVIAEVITVGFLIGHYRDALQLASETDGAISPGILTLQNFTSAPFELADLYSWLLLFLTFLFGFLGCLDGYKFDDPYPGYSKVYKKYRAAAEDFSEFLRVRYEKVLDIKDFYMDLIDKKVVVCNNGLILVDSKMHEKELMLKAYGEALRSADKAFQTLVSLFRSENTKFRQSPAPKYFQEQINLDLLELPELPSKDYTEEVEGLRKEINNIYQLAEDVREKIIRSFNMEDEKISKEKEELHD